ncbi:MAG: hypothetical protein U1C51_05920 [Candidatus Izemoplasmatales bacterium]|jgi:hypothetical protein|nr:hypothetical protein [bacterium]MDZ4196773.1 hypothetical protein [Candidatus Izemoplasmatales bacterium]
MNKLLSKLQNNKLTLIASLPENSYELAKIAWESGVDAIKVHVNVFHNASQNHFGPLEVQRLIFERILKDSPVPVGIVAGGDAESAEAILDELIAMGFDFISLYAHHTPASFFVKHQANNFLSINSSYSYEEIQSLLDGKFADFLELSIIDKEEYGSRLNARDLAKYRKISAMSDTPTVLPTQKMIYPSDIAVLAKTGIKAIMVGAVVYQNNPNKMRQVLTEFRKEIDQL